jgi:DUF971 family protein
METRITSEADDKKRAFRNASAPPSCPMPTPANVQIIGRELAIAWSDGAESFFPMELLRAASPSAANVGERDIFGQLHGGGGPKAFPGVTVRGWEQVGNYALRFDFSDGHGSGIYSYEYLRRLSEKIRAAG